MDLINTRKKVKIMAINKTYKCSWCKKILPGHPMCFDIKRDSYRGYHFYFCTECYNKIDQRK